MNTRTSIVGAKQSPDLLSIAFNQDQSCFSICGQEGFQVYNTNPLELQVSSATGGIGYAQMLHRTNYIALVGGGKKPKYPLNKIIIWDDLKQKEAMMINFMSPVLKVVVSRLYIIGFLENSVEVYSFSSPPKKLISFESAPNPTAIGDFISGGKRRGSSAGRENVAVLETSGAGLVSGSSAAVAAGLSGSAVASGAGSSVLAFPSRLDGQIQIVDLSTLTPEAKSLPICIAKAHSSPLSIVRLNPNGTLVASASDNGTLIRIHSTLNASLVKEFRRGLDRANVYEMSWSPDGARLAVISDKQTLHVYQVDPGRATELNKKHMLNKYLPDILSPAYVKSVWSFVSCHLSSPLGDSDALFHKDACRIGWDGNEELILVWKTRGIWEKYCISPREENGTAGYELVREGWRHLQELL